MNTDNREQQVDQEPKPRTWFDEETITIKAAPDIESAPAASAAPVAPAPAAPVIPVVPIQEETAEKPADTKDSEGTWIVSTTMGTAFTKYVFICSKCGYKKESFFSITPITYCPECEKRKAGLL